MALFSMQSILYQQRIVAYFVNYAMHGKGIKDSYTASSFSEQ